VKCKREIPGSTKLQGKSRLRDHACCVLSVTFAVFAFIVCLPSLWLMEAPRKGIEGILGVFFGSVGLVVTLAFALTGIVFSIIWIRRNKATRESSYMGWSLVILVLVTCSLLFLIALPWLLLRGDLS
jgi:hypothetical protein